MRLSHRSIRSLPKYLLPPLNVISSTIIRTFSTLIRISSTLIPVAVTYSHDRHPYPQCLLPHSIKPARTHAGAHTTARVRTQAQTKTIGAGKDAPVRTHAYEVRTFIHAHAHARTHAHSPDAHVGAVDEARARAESAARCTHRCWPASIAMPACVRSSVPADDYRRDAKARADRRWPRGAR